MSGQRQPVNLITAKGNKHLTKAEIESRKGSEVKAHSDNIRPPEYLPENLKDEFNRIAAELIDIEIMSNLDCEALARYLISEYQYEQITLKLLKLKSVGVRYFDLLQAQDKTFKMARTAAGDLGLTISSRCKLVVPKKEEKPQNKFSKFAAR